MRLAGSGNGEVDIFCGPSRFHLALAVNRDVELSRIDALQDEAAESVQRKIIERLAGQRQVQIAIEVEAPAIELDAPSSHP